MGAGLPAAESRKCQRKLRPGTAGGAASERRSCRLLRFVPRHRSDPWRRLHTVRDGAGEELGAGSRASIAGLCVHWILGCRQAGLLPTPREGHLVGVEATASSSPLRAAARA